MKNKILSIVVLFAIIFPVSTFALPTTLTISSGTSPLCYDDLQDWTSDTNVNRLAFFWSGGNANVAVTAGTTGTFYFSDGPDPFDPRPLSITDVWASDDGGGTWYHSGLTFTLNAGTCSGGGGGGTADLATSSREQVQENIFHGVILFFLAFAIMFGILKTT